MLERAIKDIYNAVEKSEELLFLDLTEDEISFCSSLQSKESHNVKAAEIAKVIDRLRKSKLNVGERNKREADTLEFI